MKSVAADGFATEQQARCSLQAKGDLRAIHAEYFRIASRRAFDSGDPIAGQKTKFHEPTGDVLGHVEALDDTLLAPPEFPETPR